MMKSLVVQLSSGMPLLSTLSYKGFSVYLIKGAMSPSRIVPLLILLFCQCLFHVFWNSIVRCV